MLEPTSHLPCLALPARAFRLQGGKHKDKHAHAKPGEPPPLSGVCVRAHGAKAWNDGVFPSLRYRKKHVRRHTVV